MNSDKPLVEVKDLSKTFVLDNSLVQRMLGKKPRFLKAVQRVNLDLERGETLGLVGESGCGKTTLGRCILRLYEPDEGHVFIHGIDIICLNNAALRQARRKMQIVFQDPYSSLNPRQKVGQILGEVSLVHGICTQAEVNSRVEYLLNMVGLGTDIIDRYPHQLSGGQRQRVGLARALAVEPDFIVADEPVSALDVSIQAQVINLLVELQEKLHLAMLFITHDLRLVHYISHRVAVMYMGKIVELGPNESLFAKPLHPYTMALLAALPHLDPRNRSAAPAIQGEPSSPINIPAGCSFHPRCPYAFEICAREEPKLTKIANGYFVACHLITSRN